MPSSPEVIEALTGISNAWRTVAIAWHVALGALLVGLLVGYRPSRRAMGVLLALPLASVSILAWSSGNPFNGLVFAALSLVLAVLGLRLTTHRVQMGPSLSMVFGVVLVVFGWVYPHFLETDAWTAYLYAAPLGLVPCSTLSAIVGITLIVKAPDSRPWSVVLSIASLLYGLIGVLLLDVTIDWFLVVGAVLLLTKATMTEVPKKTAQPIVTEAA